MFNYNCMLISLHHTESYKPSCDRKRNIGPSTQQEQR